MSKPHELERAFSKMAPNFELLEELYRTHQKSYIRRRLEAIRLLWQGRMRWEVQMKLDVDPSTLIEWIRILVMNGIEQGLARLATEKTVQKEGKLNRVQQQELITILRDKSPQDFGYDQYIFTGKILQEIVAEKWGISLSDQTIYNLLDRHNFSYQRGHRDYENGDPQEQREFAEGLKELLETRKEGEEVYFFDEFSITNRPSVYYGWAPKNSKFPVPSDEKKKENG